MPTSDILVLEPDAKVRQTLGKTLEGLHFRPVLSGSLDEAIQCAGAGRLEAVIADCRALARMGPQPPSALTLAARLTASIAQLRAAYASAQADTAERPAQPLRIIVTTDTENVDAHAAAIHAGADAYLRSDEAREESVIASYLTRFLQTSLATLAAASSSSRPAVAGGAPHGSATAARSVAPAHVTDAFALQDEDLRDPESGRWDAKRIAEALGVKLTELAEALVVNYSTVARTPDSDALQEKLAPFANVIAMTRQAYEQDDARLRMWLRQPQAALGDVTPLTALLRPGAAGALEQWVAGAWLGEPA